MLDTALTDDDKNKPLVILDMEDSNVGSDLVADLRVQGLNALLLDGGSAASRDTILAPDTVWPEWVVGATVETSAPTVAAYRDEVSAWMTGVTPDAPAYMAIPGTAQLPSEVATGSGGGCG